MLYVLYHNLKAKSMLKPSNNDGCHLLSTQYVAIDPCEVVLTLLILR